MAAWEAVWVEAWEVAWVEEWAAAWGAVEAECSKLSDYQAIDRTQAHPRTPRGCVRFLTPHYEVRHLSSAA